MKCPDCLLIVKPSSDGYCRCEICGYSNKPIEYLTNEDVLTLYQPNDRRDKQVSIKDYVETKIKKIKRYDNNGRCVEDGVLCVYDDLLKMFGLIDW